MNTKYADRVFRALFILAFVLGTVWMPGQSVSAQDPLPRFTVYYGMNGSIQGGNWPLGTSVTLAIDDPTTPQNPDLTETKTIIMHPDGYTWVSFDPSLDIKPGFYVSMTGDGITKDTTVMDIGQVSYDVDTDIVSGVSTPYTELQIGANWNSWRNVVTGADGSWSADFSVLGDIIGHDQIVDIQPGTRLFVQKSDEDGDQSNYDWRVLSPSLYVFLPEFHQNPYDGLTSDPQGYEWPVGLPVTMTIDRPDTTQSPDFTIPGTSGEPDPSGGMHYWFNTSGISLYPGDIITATNGETTITQIMSELAVMGIDLDTNQISGTAEPGKTVTVSLHNPWIQRHVVTGSDGNWVADFSMPGDEPDEQEVGELVPGSSFSVNDGSANCYVIRIANPNPSFSVSLDGNTVDSWDWNPNATVTLTIEDPDAPLSPDYSQSQTSDGIGTTPTFYLSQSNNFQAAEGQTVTMTDGIHTKTMTIPHLAISAVDRVTDMVTGSAAPNAEVHVWSNNGSERVVIADSSTGEWTADFSIAQNDQPAVNIIYGSTGNAWVQDEDGDQTSLLWVLPIPQCQPGDSVSGTVFEHDGITPMPSAQVQIEDFITGEPLFVTSSNQNGQFACALPDGDYRIMASANNYSAEYFYETGDPAAATPIQVTGNSQFVSINFTLTESFAIEHFTFNLSNPLLQEHAVRQAIALGTDRQRILNEAFLPNGIYGIVSNSIVGPGHWAAAPDSELTIYPYDPAQAQTILESAGWIDRDNDGYRENSNGNELAFSFKTNNRPFRVASSMIFVDNMADIGIRITPEYYPLGAFLQSRDFDIAEFAWVSSVDDYTPLNVYVSSDSQNFSGYNNPAFDAAMANFAAASNNVEKLPYLIDAQILLSQDLPILPLFTRYSVNPVSVPTGSNITVSLESYLTVHFDQVETAGQATVISTDSSTFSLPQNFQLLGQVYDIGSNAQFTNAQVCFTYDDTGLLPGQEASIRLFHLENNAWADVTDSGYPDTANNKVCGTVTSFSPFAIMYANDITPPVITWVGSINDGDNFYFSFVPPAPTCTATDEISGVDGACTVTGYTTTVGTHTLIAIAKDKAGNQASEFRTYTVTGWTLSGFYPPVDMNGIFNVVKNGSTVPFKFEIFAGLIELTDVADVKSFTYAETACNASAIADEIELTATGGTLLRYDATAGQFIYNWKTPKTPGKCLRVTMFTIDGSSLVAYFKLK